MPEENKPTDEVAPTEATVPTKAVISGELPGQQEQPETHDGAVAKPPKPPGLSPRAKLALLIILVILIVLVITAFIGKNYLTKQAMQSQTEYERICVMLKGEIAQFIDEPDRSLHCISSQFEAKDKNRSCTCQADCVSGACIGDTSDPIFDPPDPTTEDAALVPPVRCSDGIRLLPQFDAPVPEPEEEL